MLFCEISSMKRPKEISYIIFPAIIHCKIMTRNFSSSSVLYWYSIAVKSVFIFSFGKGLATQHPFTSEGMMLMSFNCYHLKWLYGLEKVCTNQKLDILIFEGFHLWNYLMQIIPFSNVFSSCYLVWCSW